MLRGNLQGLGDGWICRRKSRGVPGAMITAQVGQILVERVKPLSRLWCEVRELNFSASLAEAG